MNKNTLLIVDDHDIVVLGLRHVIQTSFPGTFDVHSAKTGREALRKIAETRYSLYILDLELPDITGFEVIDYIRRNYSDSRIIVHTQHDELWYHRKLVKYHVNGICLKSTDAQNLVEAIQQVMNGDSYLFSKAAVESKSKVFDIKSLGKDLSEREMSVLKCISLGHSTTEIATELCISENTVETHRRHLNEKLGAKNTASLIMNAVKCGLLTVLED